MKHEASVTAWAPWAAASGVALLVGCWLSMSAGFCRHDADTIVPKLASTMHWTPYYWYTARNGQLLPLLAMPFRHPLWNLVAQQLLGTFSGIMAIYLLVAYAMRGRGWFVSGTAAVAGFLGASTWYGQFHFLEGAHTYGTGTFLVVTGLFLLRRTSWRRPDIPAIAGAAVLMVLGLWVNLLAFILAALLVAADAFRPPLRLGSLRRMAIRGGVAMAVLVAALLVNVVASKIQASSEIGRDVSFGFVPLARYPSAVLTTAAKAMDWVAGNRGAMLVAVAAVAAAWLSGAQAWPREASVLAVAGFGFIILVGGMQWVAMNAGAPRYLMPGIVSLFACATMLPLAVLRRTLAETPLRRLGAFPGGVAGVGAVVAALLGSYGPPDPAAQRRAIASRTSPLAEQVVASGADFVAGDYWRVWPVVFQANLILYEQGSPRRIWGIAPRAIVTRHLWNLERRGGNATLAHLAKPPQGSPKELEPLCQHLRIELGESLGSKGEIDFYRFRLKEDRVARR